MTSPDPVPGVRVTLHPGEDLLLRPGARLGELRGDLAALLRRPELAHQALLADGVLLAEDAVVGVTPLLPGAVLTVRSGLQGLGAAPGTAGEGCEGAALVGRAGGAARLLAPPVARRGPGRVALLTALLPAAASLGLAAALHQPVLGLFAVVGLIAVVPQVLDARRRSREHGRRALSLRGRIRGPDALLAFAEALCTASSSTWQRARSAWAALRTEPPVHTGDPASGPPVTLAPWPPGLSRWPAVRLADALVEDGTLTVTGTAARAVARAVVACLAARGASVDVVGPRAGAWAWCRWLPRGTGPSIVVVDAPDPEAARAVPARAGDLVLLCVAAAELDRAGPGVSEAWAETLARHLARAAWLGRSAVALTSGAPPADVDAPPGGPDPADPRLPGAVTLSALHGPAGTSRDVLERWAAAEGWAVPLGLGAADAPVAVDLVADGPHLLVAGTTGSGKSELLQTLVLGVALRRSPADLALVLVDFKGGAGLGACSGLPHVVGQVTDLEPGLAARALAGLGAELRRRKAVLAEHGVPDVGRLPHGVLPRLVVVMDEFRALTDDHPEFLPGLLRVAAQGRSLGVHLVLATQRPAGAVSADLRANVTARVALRVVDAAESRDVVGCPTAARIPVALPGRALLQVGAEPPVLLQTACAAVPPRPEPPVVRRAPAGPGHAAVERGGGGGSAPGAGDGLHGQVAGDAAGHSTRNAAAPVQQIVEDLRSAAEMAHLRPGPAPWLPPLPERVMADDPAVTALATLQPEVTRPASGSVPLALGDLPDEQRRALVAWDPADGHLAVVGRARSGRTTALLTLATEALRRGLRVHAVVSARSAGRFGALRTHAGFGTLTGPHDPAAVTALLRSLTDAPPTKGPHTQTSFPKGTIADEALAENTLPTLVVVDGVEALRAALPPALPGQDPLWGALTEGPAFALSADGPSVGGLTARVGPRIVLLGNDRHADAALGAPIRFAGAGGPPGRAVWLGPGDPVLCQVYAPPAACGRPRARPLTPRS